ncbi:Asx homology domain-containing protein [Parachaetomium inaequale]|uniref:Asx homology domain-containing protein n=1 Tax=Parachaetomium inaequale TaxID=2588326 RepID=A0AAN6PMS7_9PEZI|nr:Asx homology domain-containing protein [Parachaetomium inaequale]
MADEVPSSPLSSPPESVVNVVLGSPAKSESKLPAASSDRQEPTVEAAVEVTAKQPSPSPDGKVEAQEKPIAHDSDEGGQSSTQKRKASISRKSAPAKKVRRVLSAPRKSAQDKKWEAPFVYTDSKSPLANADLRAILLHPEAWDILTPEERRDVLAKFPDETHVLDAGTQDARPNPVSLRNDDNFRHDCARYCENIELGRHDEEWLSQAWVAHEKHKRGDYDQFLREQFEEDWDTKLPAESKTGDAETDDESKQGESPASKGTSRRSTRSPQGREGREGREGRNAATKGSLRTEVTVGNSETPQPTGSSGIRPSNPSATSQAQEAARSTVVVRSD